MKDIIPFIVPAVGLVVNLLWSVLNMRLLASMRKEFVTREEFHAEQRVQEVLHAATAARLARAGA